MLLVVNWLFIMTIQRKLRGLDSYIIVQKGTSIGLKTVQTMMSFTLLLFQLWDKCELFSWKKIFIVVMKNISFHDNNSFFSWKEFVFMLSYCLSYLGLFQLNSKENIGRLWLVSKLITAWNFTLYVRKYCCKVVLL